MNRWRVLLSFIGWLGATILMMFWLFLVTGSLVYGLVKGIIKAPEQGLAHALIVVYNSLVLYALITKLQEKWEELRWWW